MCSTVQFTECFTCLVRVVFSSSSCGRSGILLLSFTEEEAEFKASPSGQEAGKASNLGPFLPSPAGLSPPSRQGLC